MDEQQRRVWERMIASVDEYRAGDVALEALVRDLPGHLQAADVREPRIIDEFWDVFPAIEAELELGTEPWAPPGLASDKHLAEAVEAFRSWAARAFAEATNERE